MRTRLTVFAIIAGCVTPPAVRSAGRRTLDLTDFPAGTELVEIGNSGQKLRGVFVPGDPVVLSLPESGGSITRGPKHGQGYGLAWDLHALGMGFLCVDYRGVGASDGEASVKQLRADVRTAWKEAVRRAGGDSGRVVLRGVSLGGLGASLLLEDGARPAVVVVAAPVRAKTAVPRFADEWAESGAERLLARLVVRRPVRTDLVRALQTTTGATLVVAGANDPYLSNKERALFRDAAGEYVELADADHDAVVDSARGLLEAERHLYLKTFAELPRLAERIERIRREVPGAPGRDQLAPMLARFAGDVPSTEAAVAMALSPNDLRRSPALENWLRTLPPLPLEAARALASFDDPTGRLDLVDFFGWTAWVRGQTGPHTPQRLLEAIIRTRRWRRVTMRVTNNHRDGRREVREWTWADLDESTMVDGGPVPDGGKMPARLRLPPREMLRQGLLLALKAALIPARTITESGQHEIEVFERGRWHRIPLPASIPK